VLAETPAPKVTDAAILTREEFEKHLRDALVAWRLVAVKREDVPSFPVLLAHDAALRGENEELKALVREVIADHEVPERDGGNGCKNEPCAWCEAARAALRAGGVK
jgi:hypothetical protein